MLAFSLSFFFPFLLEHMWFKFIAEYKYLCWKHRLIRVCGESFCVIFIFILRYIYYLFFSEGVVAGRIRFCFLHFIHFYAFVFFCFITFYDLKDWANGKNIVRRIFESKHRSRKHVSLFNYCICIWSNELHANLIIKKLK